MGDGGWSGDLAGDIFLPEDLYPSGRREWIGMKLKCIVGGKYVRVCNDI